jgi:hypothetical protein
MLQRFIPTTPERYAPGITFQLVFTLYNYPIAVGFWIIISPIWLESKEPSLIKGSASYTALKKDTFSANCV